MTTETVNDCSALEPVVEQAVRVYTTEEAAAIVGISRNAIYEEVASGRLKCRRVGKKLGRILISEDNLRQWANGEDAAK